MGGTNELRLLIVETDAIAYRAIERTLAVTVDPSGPLVNRRASATSINGALAQLAFEPIDVVLVRWGQRLLDAVDVVHAIRRDGDHTPIAVYDPAGRSELEVASILNAGADDFMSTPELRPNELIARLRVLQRRRPFSGHRRFTVGRITFDVERREVLVDDKNINASTGEYRLLSYMARRVGAVITRRELYLAVFETHDVDKRSNALAAAISRLRRKLGAAGDQLVAVAGVGYRLDDARTSGMRLAAASLASSSSLEIHSKDRG